MRLSYEKFTGAIQKVGAMIDNQKNAPGVMFDIRGDEFRVCFFNLKQGIIEKLPVINEEGFEERIVVSWNSLNAVLSAMQPKGPLYVDEIEITIDESKATFSVEKKLKMKDEEGNVEDKSISRITQSIPCNKPEDSVKYSTLTRLDYDSIFSGDEYDIWDSGELRDILIRASADNSGVSYVSSSRRAAFAVNVAFTTNIPIYDPIKFGFTISSNLATTIASILSKLPGTNVKIHVVDNRYVNIASEDDTVGIWFDMPPGNRADLAVLHTFEEKEYNLYRLVFCRPALQNIIECACSGDNEKAEIEFIKDDGGMLAARIAEKGGNDFVIVVEHYVDSQGDIKNLKMTVNLRVLKNMLDNCNEMYVALDLAKDERGVFLRVGDIVGTTNEEGQDLVLGTVHYTMLSKN